MSSLAESESYRFEATTILNRAEEVARQLSGMEVCEGHRLMVSQSIVALKHLSRLIEMNHRRVSLSAVPHTIILSPPSRRNWRSMIWRTAGDSDRIAEVPT